MIRSTIAVLLGAAALAPPPPDSSTTLQSPAIVSRLTAALHEHKLDAIAVKDPDEADRFVAALFYPESQLLVISARSADAARLETRLSYKQYRDVYVELQGQPIAGSSLFVQDMKADGLPDAADDTTDIVYQGDGSTLIFDGNWRKRGTTEEAYRRQLAEADRDYARALTLLLANIEPT